MNKNNIVGWVALAFLILIGILFVAGVAGAMDSPNTVTTTCSYDYTSCTTSVR